MSAIGTRTVRELVSVLGTDVIEIIGRDDRIVARPMPIGTADADAISFCSYEDKRAAALIRTTSAGTLLVSSCVELPTSSERTYVIVQNPRRDFLRLVARGFAPPARHGIHPSVVVDENAHIHPTAFVGARAVIGNCVIGANSVIHPGVVLYDHVRIGSGVIIHSGAIIGADGFGYARNESGQMEKFLHLGGVVIGDDVEIGANTCIDRGTLGDTIVQRGAKIDNLVHIAHNVDVGEDAVVIAQSLVGGSSVIGARAWIAPCACIRDGVTIGSNATVGLGAVVTKNVENDAVVMGAPARDATAYKQMLATMTRLSAA